MEIFEYENRESFKIYKEVYSCLKEMSRRFKAMFRAYSTIKRLNKLIPKYWHIIFYYSDCTESSINFWHPKSSTKENNPSGVFKQLCEDVEKELGIEMTKTWGTWNDEVESLEARGHFNKFSINIYQYQADHCDFIIVEKKVKQVVLTGDCVNF